VTRTQSGHGAVAESGPGKQGPVTLSIADRRLWPQSYRGPRPCSIPLQRPSPRAGRRRLHAPNDGGAHAEPAIGATHLVEPRYCCLPRAGCVGTPVRFEAGRGTAPPERCDTRRRTLLRLAGSGECQHLGFDEQGEVASTFGRERATLDQHAEFHVVVDRGAREVGGRDEGIGGVADRALGV
jgi:hypothetical protein